jgi:hypothetical protein
MRTGNGCEPSKIILCHFLVSKSDRLHDKETSGSGPVARPHQHTLYRFKSRPADFGTALSVPNSHLLFTLHLPSAVRPPHPVAPDGNFHFSRVTHTEQ